MVLSNVALYMMQYEMITAEYIMRREATRIMFVIRCA